MKLRNLGFSPSLPCKGGEGRGEEGPLFSILRHEPKTDFSLNRSRNCLSLPAPDMPAERRAPPLPGPLLHFVEEREKNKTSSLNSMAVHPDPLPQGGEGIRLRFNPPRPALLEDPNNAPKIFPPPKKCWETVGVRGQPEHSPNNLTAGFNRTPPGPGVLRHWA